MGLLTDYSFSLPVALKHAGAAFGNATGQLSWWPYSPKELTALVGTYVSRLTTTGDTAYDAYTYARDGGGSDANANTTIALSLEPDVGGGDNVMLKSTSDTTRGENIYSSVRVIHYNGNMPVDLTGLEYKCDIGAKNQYTAFDAGSTWATPTIVSRQWYDLNTAVASRYMHVGANADGEPFEGEARWGATVLGTWTIRSKIDQTVIATFTSLADSYASSEQT